MPYFDIYPLGRSFLAGEFLKSLKTEENLHVIWVKQKFIYLEVVRDLPNPNPKRPSNAWCDWWINPEKWGKKNTFSPFPLRFPSVVWVNVVASVAHLHIWVEWAQSNQRSHSYSSVTSDFTVLDLAIWKDFLSIKYLTWI